MVGTFSIKYFLLYNIFFYCITPLVVAQNPTKLDTIALKFNEVLFTPDTLYIGIADSIVLLPNGTKYSIERNRLMMKMKYYEKKEKRKEQALFLYEKLAEAALKPNARPTPPEEIKDGFNLSDDYFNHFEGKVIRSIHFHHVAILEGNVADTTIKATSFLAKPINKYHYHTRNWVLRQNLKFQEGDNIKPRIISDNERIIRNLEFIEDTKIQLLTDSIYTDSVDVLIVTKDNFPWGINANPEGVNKITVSPYYTNTLGIGHYWEGSLIAEPEASPPIGYGTIYKIPNIQGTFIQSKIEYIKTHAFTRLGFNLNKPFLTNDTKIGGEFNYLNTKESHENQLIQFDSTLIHYTYKGQFIDFWSGYSFVFSDLGDKPNLILALRSSYEFYHERPFVNIDSNFVFHNKRLNLGGITLQKISYYKTNRLLGFGITEDIPFGYSFQAVGGYLNNDYFHREYFGINGEWAKFHPRIGHFSFFIGNSSYFYQGIPEDIISSTSISYFSPMINIGLGMRNLFKITYDNISNPRYETPFNFGNEIRGLKQDGVNGYSSLNLRYQAVFFSNWKFAGFNFSAAPFMDLGWIAAKENFTSSQQLFAAYGFTLSTKNESLSFPALNIHFNYYPNWIGEDYKITISFSFRDFNLISGFFSPKPTVLKTRTLN